jgi:hypothetical protein
MYILLHKRFISEQICELHSKLFVIANEKWVSILLIHWSYFTYHDVVIIKMLLQVQGRAVWYGYSCAFRDSRDFEDTRMLFVFVRTQACFIWDSGFLLTF